MPEQQEIEWKESWRDEYLKWLCGYANAHGGTLFIGKDDDGNVVGVQGSKKLMEDLPNKITNALGIIADVNLLCDHGKDYIEIKVESIPHSSVIMESITTVPAVSFGKSPEKSWIVRC